MRTALAAVTLLLVLAVTAGCGVSHPQRRTLAKLEPAGNVTKTAGDAEAARRATLPLEQIGPPVELPSNRHAEPDPAPLSALALYARARYHDERERVRAQKAKVANNVARLSEGHAAHDMLLWGSRGMGNTIR